MAGRTTLVKAVLTAMPSYHMQTVLLLIRVINDLERRNREFLWGQHDDRRKMHLVSWEYVTKDKKQGGLGIRNLKNQNKAFLMKLCWGLITKLDALWVKVLRSKYRCRDHALPIVEKKRISSLTWRGICAVWDHFRCHLGKRIGDGRNTSFWFENWSNLNLSLIDLVPGIEWRVDRNERVIDYFRSDVRSDGEWDIQKLQRWFTPDIIDHITCAYPPSQERGEDEFFFKPSSNGYFFFVKSAHFSLSAGTDGANCSIWKILW